MMKNRESGGGGDCSRCNIVRNDPGEGRHGLMKLQLPPPPPPPPVVVVVVVVVAVVAVVVVVVEVSLWKEK